MKRGVTMLGKSDRKKTEPSLFEQPYALYDGTPPHVQGNETSREAAESMRQPGVSIRARVLEFIARRGLQGATDDEIERVLGLRHQTASARRRELVLQGLLEKGGTRLTRAGRRAAVWRVI